MGTAEGAIDGQVIHNDFTSPKGYVVQDTVSACHTENTCERFTRADRNRSPTGKCLRYYGTMVLRYYGTTALLHYGTTALTYCGTTLSRYYSTMVLRQNNTMVTLYHGTYCNIKVVQYYGGTGPTVGRSDSATVLQCTTVPPWTPMVHRGTMVNCGTQCAYSMK